MSISVIFIFFPIFTLLVHILGFLSSPKDLYSAIAASSRLYRIFTAYRHSVTSAVLQEAIPPEIECDSLLAFRAQAIWKHVPEGNNKAEIDCSQDDLDSLDQESTAVLDESRSGRTKEIYNLAPDSGRSPRLWNFYRKFEHFIQLYIARALSTLQQSSLDSDESNLQLSLSEETRLKRAFFRCEVYTCLFQISQTTHKDTRDEAPHTDPGPAYIETYPPWEIEEIACIVHFYTNLIQELCERIEDDFITFVREKATECASPVHGNEENRLSTWLDYHSIDWYSESSKRHLRQTHIDYPVSRGMLAVWKLTHVPGPSQIVRKMVVATHFTSNDVPSIMFQLQRATSIVRSDQTDSRTRSPGWAWASEAMTPYHRLRAAVHSEYNLRNQGYVFWDRERLLKYNQFQTPRSLVKDWYEFPLGHQRYTDTPGVETKLKGVRVHEEVIRDISDDINGRVCKYDENGNEIFYTEGRKEGGEEEYVISWREQIYSSTLQY